jgi:hypothetical protein
MATARHVDGMILSFFFSIKDMLLYKCLGYGDMHKGKLSCMFYSISTWAAKLPSFT